MKTRTKPYALFLHGFLGQPADWSQVLEHIPNLPNWDICCFNLWDDLPLLEFGSMEEWVDALADRCRPILPIFLCGYSLGARLAMALVCRHPDLIGSLVVISGHPGFLSESEKSLRSLDDRRWGEIFVDKPWPEAIDLWNQREVFGGHQIRPAAGSLSPLQLQRSLEIFSLGRQPDLRPCLQKLEMPVLWIVGENDSKFMRLTRESWIAESPIIVQAIPDCGHRVPQEKPRELAALLGPFFTLNTLTGGDA